MKYKKIGIECDICGHRYEKAKIVNYTALRSHLIKIGWQFSDDKDYCSICKVSELTKWRKGKKK